METDAASGGGMSLAFAATCSPALRVLAGLGAEPALAPTELMQAAATGGVPTVIEDQKTEAMLQPPASAPGETESDDPTGKRKKRTRRNTRV
jgi:hypothetical protein